MNRLITLPIIFASFFIVSCDIVHFQNPMIMGNRDEVLFGIEYGGEIGFRTITVDGEPTGSEWDDIHSVIDDKTGDSLYNGTGGDIKSLHIAIDSNFLYFLIVLADDTPSTSQEFAYRVWIQNPETDNKETGNVELGVGYNGASWEAHAYEWDGSNWVDVAGYDPGWGAVLSHIELKIDRSMVIQKDELRIEATLQEYTLPENPDWTKAVIFSLP